MRAIWRASRNRSGNVLTEFAILLPVMLSLIIFIIEGAFQLLTAAVLEYGLREAARFGVTGQAIPSYMAANPPASRQAAMARIITLFGHGLIKQAHLSVTETSYGAFSSVNSPGAGTSGPGGPLAAVQYTVTYFQPWLMSDPTYLPVKVTGLSGVAFSRTMVVQNEPFPSN
jgi:Flp pilus assembly protein TadG